MTAETKNFGASGWADEPLEEATEDELGRAPFVDTVSAQINLAAASDPSTVFGLVGEWGSGKTSIIRQVKNQLSDDWVVADFTPWSSGDTGTMSLEFVTTLADALGVAASGESRAKFARYASFVTPFLSAIPLAGAGASAAAGDLLANIAARPPWHKQFQELSETVADTGLRVLIVIDDVDRLGGSELMNLLRIVRLLGRFRGVHYLIAYDQETIEELLASSGSVGRATSFMEKIVQYPFEVPPISRAAALRLTHELISQLLRASGSQLDEVGLHREAELAQVLADMVRTPRTLRRFTSQLLAFAPHVRDAELDALDYTAMTWLRLEAHGVWSELPRWRAELSTGTRPAGLLKTEKIPVDEWLTRISSAHSSEDAGDIARVLDLMFPGFSLAEISSYYHHPRAVADEAYFGRYLLLALPEDDVSDELIVTVVDGLVVEGRAERAGDLAAILDGSASVANLAISRAFKHRLDAQQSSRALLDFIFARAEARKDDARGPGEPRTTMSPWLAREVALNVEAGQITADEVIVAVGEEEAFSIVTQFSHVLRNRERAKAAARGFADYWLAALTERAGELVSEPHRLASAIELVVFVHGVDRVQGIFDHVIVDFESYQRVASAFVRYSRWVGRDVTYEIKYSKDAFQAVVPLATRERFHEQVRQARTEMPYETEDLPEPNVDDEVLRQFVLDSIRDETGSDEGTSPN